jgi:Acetyltransferase (GNAT) domain
MRLAENEMQTKSAEEQALLAPLTLISQSGIGGLEFRTFRDRNELETLRSIWKSWPGARESDFDLFLCSIKSTAQPHVILLSRNAVPESLLIGRRERKRMPFRLGYLAVSQREVDVIEFVHGGLRGNASDENCADMVREVMRSLAEGEADLAVWEHLEVNSPLHRQAIGLPGFSQREHSRCLKHRWIMKFPNGLNAFLMSLRRSQRSKLRRKYKKVPAVFPGKVRVKCYRSLAEIDAVASDMELIAGKTAKRKLGFGFSDTPRAREQMAIAAENGWLRAYVLYIEDKPVSFWTGIVYQRCLHADHVAYDPSYAEVSPGIFLFLSMLEDLRDEDIESIDFGRGTTQLRESFCDVQRAESRTHIFAPTWRGLQLNILHTAVHLANGCFVAVLRHLGCLDSVRKAWRNKLLRRRQQQDGRGFEAAVSDATQESQSLVFEE